MTSAPTPSAVTASQLGFERLTSTVKAAEGAFRRLVDGLGSMRDLIAESLALERERRRLLGQGSPAAAATGPSQQLVANAAAAASANAQAVQQAQGMWQGFGDKLAETFKSLFETIAKDGRLKFESLFRTLSPLASDLLSRLTGFDFAPILEALGKLVGGGSIGGSLGKFASLIGGLLGGTGGAGGLLGPLLGGTGGLGSIAGAISGLFGSLFGGGGAAGAIAQMLPIPGVNLITAAIPLVASLFADKDYPFAKAGVAAFGGSLVSDAFALDGGPLDKISQLGDAVARTLQDVFDRLGATVGDLADLTAIGYSSGRKSILPKGFFAGTDATHGADFATGAVFSGIEDPQEAMLRAVQAGLLRAFETGAVQGVAAHDATTVTVGLRRAMAADFTTVEDGLADIAFLRDFGRTLERLNAAGDPAALQRVELRDRADEQGEQDALRIREFLERATRLFAPLNDAAADADGEASLASRPAEPVFEYDEGRRFEIDGPAGATAITDEGAVVGYDEPPSVPSDTSVSTQLVMDDDEAAAERLAEARAAIDHYVRALLGLGEAAADTRPLTGYALQLAEAEARLDGLSGALREAGYSAEEAAQLIEQGTEAARERLRGAYEDDLARDLRGAQGLGAVDRVGDLVEAYDTRRAEGTALGADVSGLDELLRLEVEGLVSAGTLSVAALEALRVEFADNAIVTDALGRALAGHTAAANDNAAAQMTLADVTRLATRELDAQIREQEQVKRSAEAVVEAIADTRRRLDLDPALSILSPREQLEQARLRFEDLAGRSLAGDQTAQRELPDASQTYLELARDFYASNEDYARVFRQVDAALRDTGDVAERQLEIAEKQLEELTRLRRALTGEIGDLPNPGAVFGHNPTRNRILARLTGYAGDFGGGGFGTFRAGLSPEINALVDAIASSVNFAGGGLMTAGGPLPLHSYARGGIARRPQLALFGEGRMPEAFVPLPDGRSIPVTVTAPANDRGPREPDAGAARRTAGIEALVEETRRLRADLAGLRGENAALRRGLERIAAGINTGEGGMSRFADLLADPYAARRYLVTVEPYDPALGSTRVLRFSDHGFVSRPDDDPPNAWFEPRLVTALNFERQLFAGGRLEGRSVPGFGALSLNNADGGLDGLAALAWDGRRVRVELGGNGFRLDDFGTVLDGTAEQIEFDDLLVTVRLRDLQARLETEVARASYAGTGGTEGREGLAGRPRPLCFGRVLRVPAVLVDPAALLYQVHDGPIAEVDAVYDRGLALTKVTGTPAAGQFRSDPATGCFTLGASPAGTVAADVRGDAAGGHVETVAALVRRIATTRAGFADPDDLDTAAFAALDAAAPAAVGLFVDAEATVDRLLDDLVDAIGGHFGFDRAGRLTVGRLAEPSAGADAEFDEVQILELERVAVARPVWRQRIGYARYWRTLDPSGVAGAVDDETRADLGEGFRYAAAEDPAIRERHLLAEEAVRDTALALAVDAEAEAIRRLALHGADRDAFRVRLKTQPFALDLGRTVRIRYPRYGLAGGRNLLVVGMVEDAAVNEVTLDLWG